MKTPSLWSRLLRMVGLRAYEGASPKDGWRPRRPGASANTDHRADAYTLRTRARSLYQNVPYVTRAIDGLVSAYVGSGVSIYSASKSTRVRKRYEAALKEWEYTCDADGIRSLSAIIADAERAAAIDGECLIRRRIRTGRGNPVQVQLLEIDWLDSAKIGQLADGGSIVSGIEYDAMGRVRGYWLYDKHPGETLSAGRMDSRMVPAAEIIHYYEPRRPGQGRGITKLHSVIGRVRDLSLYEDAELARKNLESRMGLVASGSPDGLMNPRSGETTIAADQADARDLGQLPAGGIVEIPPGLNITAFEPKAAPGYVDTVVLSLQLIAAGVGVPYHVATGDMTRVNFSSARIRDIDYRRDVEQHQWMCMVPRLLIPLCRWFADGVQLMDGTPADYAFDFSMPRWDYVNPKQDLDAERQALESGSETLSEVLRRKGRDPATHFAEMAADVAALEATGAIKLMELMRGAPPAPPEPQPQDTQQEASDAT
jgi:lambda family phage portal protein